MTSDIKQCESVEISIQQPDHTHKVGGEHH